MFYDFLNLNLECVHDCGVGIILLDIMTGSPRGWWPVFDGDLLSGFSVSQLVRVDSALIRR